MLPHLVGGEAWQHRRASVQGTTEGHRIPTTPSDLLEPLSWLYISRIRRIIRASFHHTTAHGLVVSVKSLSSMQAASSSREIASSNPKRAGTRQGFTDITCKYTPAWSLYFFWHSVSLSVFFFFLIKPAVHEKGRRCERKRRAWGGYRESRVHVRA